MILHIHAIFLITHIPPEMCVYFPWYETPRGNWCWFALWMIWTTLSSNKFLTFVQQKRPSRRCIFFFSNSRFLKSRTLEFWWSRELESVSSFHHSLMMLRPSSPKVHSLRYVNTVPGPGVFFPCLVVPFVFCFLFTICRRHSSPRSKTPLKRVILNSSWAPRRGSGEVKRAPENKGTETKNGKTRSRSYCEEFAGKFSAVDEQ